MASLYTREALIGEHKIDPDKLTQAEGLARAYLDAVGAYLDAVGAGGFVVIVFHRAPQLLQDVCRLNGGDEDWFVLTHVVPDDLPHWVLAMDSCCDPDIYMLNGVNIVVASHA